MIWACIFPRIYIVMEISHCCSTSELTGVLWIIYIQNKQETYIVKKTNIYSETETSEPSFIMLNFHSQTKQNVNWSENIMTHRLKTLKILKVESYLFKGIKYIDIRFTLQL